MTEILQTVVIFLMAAAIIAQEWEYRHERRRRRERNRQFVAFMRALQHEARRS